MLIADKFCKQSYFVRKYTSFIYRLSLDTLSEMIAPILIAVFVLRKDSANINALMTESSSATLVNQASPQDALAKVSN